MYVLNLLNFNRTKCSLLFVCSYDDRRSLGKFGARSAYPRQNVQIPRQGEARELVVPIPRSVAPSMSWKTDGAINLVQHT